jgi:pimeloyl-ACP methyl ester carboxylesterase
METTLVEFGEGIMCREAPGPGDKVLWIHGYSMDSSLWLALWQHLPNWHHIGIDLPYHGQSADWPATYSMPEFVQCVGNMALACGVRHIAGLSLGAILTLQLATEFPTSFRSVTLGSAGLAHGPNDPYAGPHYWRLGRLYRQNGAGPWMTEHWMRWPPDIFKGAAEHDDLWRRLVAVIDSHRWEEFRTGFITQLTRHNQMEDLNRIGLIQSPTLLVVGEQEMAAFKKAAAILEETIPRCQVVYLPQAGHLCLLEQPAASAEVIERHWQQVGANDQ